VIEYTRPATWDDVKQLANELELQGAEYALVGGYAIAAHGFNRFSEDIDILVNPSADNSRKWILALAKLPDHATEELLSTPDVFAEDKQYALRVNDEITVDVMPSIAGHSWEEMKPHIMNIEIDGITIRVLDLSGLLKTKQGVRPKDRMDAAVLAAAIERLNVK
jgi:hypothetical protein